MIKCVHCGSRLEEPQPAAAHAGGPGGAPSGAGVPAGSPAPSPDPWVVPAARTEPRTPAGTTLPPATATALRGRPPRRADPPLLAAGALAMVAAAVAWTSLSLPWVTATLSVTQPRQRVREVAELPFLAQDAIARNLVIGVAVVIGLLGLVWFWYGLDRGVELPALARPAVGALAGIVGWGTVGLARLGTFVWEAGFVAHAREAGITREAMREILADRASRAVHVVAEAGTTRFAVAASLALLAAFLAWWSQRDRAT